MPSRVSRRRSSKPPRTGRRPHVHLRPERAFGATSAQRRLIGRATRPPSTTSAKSPARGWPTSSRSATSIGRLDKAAMTYSFGQEMRRLSECSTRWRRGSTPPSGDSPDITRLRHDARFGGAKHVYGRSVTQTSKRAAHGGCRSLRPGEGLGLRGWDRISRGATYRRGVNAPPSGASVRGLMKTVHVLSAGVHRHRSAKEKAVEAPPSTGTVWLGPATAPLWTRPTPLWRGLVELRNLIARRHGTAITFDLSMGLA